MAWATRPAATLLRLGPAARRLRRQRSLRNVAAGSPRKLPPKLKCVEHLGEAPPESGQALSRAEAAPSPEGLPKERYRLPRAAHAATVLGRRVRHVLVVGDGDLSFSAACAAAYIACPDEAFRHRPIDAVGASGGEGELCLLATTWEDLDELKRVFSGAADSIAKLRNVTSLGTGLQRSCEARVLGGVDATRLHTSDSPLATRSLIPTGGFDRVVWNFPHVRGKANLRENRRLLREFVASAAAVMQPAGGEILVTLREGQGGVGPCTESWGASFQLPAAAADAGLLVTGAWDFEAMDLPTLSQMGYRTRGWRGRDERFPAGSGATTYALTRGTDNGQALCWPVYTFEVHLWCPSEMPAACSQLLAVTLREALAGTAFAELDVFQLRFIDTWTRTASDGTGQGKSNVRHAFCITIGSGRQGLGRAEADRMRLRVEKALQEPGGLPGGMMARQGKMGGRVSKPQPCVGQL